MTDHRDDTLFEWLLPRSCLAIAQSRTDLARRGVEIRQVRSEIVTSRRHVADVHDLLRQIDAALLGFNSQR